MVRIFLLSLGVSLAIAGSYYFAKVSDQWFNRQQFSIARPAAEPSQPLSEESGYEEESVLEEVAETGLDRFLGGADWDLGKFELELALSENSMEGLEDLFIDAISRDLEEGSAFEAAGMILEEITGRDRVVGEALLSALSPAEKEKLSASFAKGWAVEDPSGAWDWITMAWMNPQGEYVDRALQYDLFREALDSVLLERKDYQLAANLVRQEYEPELKSLLAGLIARRVVSDNPSEALSRIAFDSDDEIDQAIMDAIVNEWAQRDSLSVKDWTLAHEDQVSTIGVRNVAKQLLLNDASGELASFHSGLENASRKDAVASEAGRLLARRSPDAAASWLNTIVSASQKKEAVGGALYELGHDDFDATVGLLDGVYGVREPDRLPLMTAALVSWSEVDEAVVATYLASGVEVFLPQSLEAFRDYVGAGL